MFYHTHTYTHFACYSHSNRIKLVMQHIVIPFYLLSQYKRFCISCWCCCFFFYLFISLSLSLPFYELWINLQSYHLSPSFCFHTWLWPPVHSNCVCEFAFCMFARTGNGEATVFWQSLWLWSRARSHSLAHSISLKTCVCVCVCCATNVKYPTYVKIGCS